MLFKLPDFGTLYVDGVAFTSSLLRFPLTQIYSLLYVSMGLVGAVYAGVGLLSYLAWPRVKAGSITAELSENYPGSPLLVFSTVAVILAVVLTFPVQLFPAVEILEVRAGFRESMASATPTGGFDMLHDVETPVQPPMRSYSDGTAFKPPHWKKEGGSANLPLPRPDNRGEEGPTPAAAIGCGRGGACMSKVDEDDDGTEIYLQLRGENFTHVIDLDTFRNTSEGKMTQNLRLSQDGSGSGFFSGLGCCLVLFGLVFMSTLLRTVSGLATPRGRAAFQGYREPERHDCPICSESVAQHNLVKHLIFEHDYDPMDAGEAAGLVMRKSWSKEERR